MPSEKIILMHRLTGLLLQLVLTECFCAVRAVPGQEGGGECDRRALVREITGCDLCGDRLWLSRSEAGRPVGGEMLRCSSLEAGLGKQGPAVLWAWPRRTQGTGGGTAEGRPETSSLFT